MSQKNEEFGTEWIFCRDIEGKCSGLNPNTKVLDKQPKTIKIHGEDVSGWMVKILQEEAEGHISISAKSSDTLSDE